MSRWDGFRFSFAVTFVIALSMVAPIASTVSAQGASAAAPTAEARDRARVAYGAGQTAFRAGDFTTALTRFEEAFAAVPNAVVFKSIAECHERLGNVSQAVSAFERYLNESASINDRAAIEARVADLRSRPGRLAVSTTPAGAAISVDGTSRGAAPITLELSPGAHSVVATASGRETVTREVTLSFADEQTLAIELPAVAVAAAPAPVTQPEAEAATQAETTEPTAAVEAEPTADESRAAEAVTEAANEGGMSDGMKIAMWSSVGVGAAGLVSGTVLGFLALGAQRDFDDTPTSAIAERGRNYSIFADMSFLLAAGGALTALTLYLTESAPPEAPAEDGEAAPAASRTAPHWAVAPLLAPNTGGVSARVEF